MSEITAAGLQALCDFDVQEQLVRTALANALAEPYARVRFLGRYTSWNGLFGSGVAALAGKIGRSRGLFFDAEQPLRAVADRSVYVASYFFDAARDEFDDRDTVHRDTHRCLAQSTLMATIDYENAAAGLPMSIAEVNVLLADPPWLAQLNSRVATGYGAGSPDELQSIFESIGYHLGSELLADREFSIIDETLRTHAPGLVEYLQGTQVSIAGQEHAAYQWIAIHSGHGGGAEADHFEWATQGARLALRFSDRTGHASLRAALDRGFVAFARDHREFFERVVAD